AMKAKSRSKLSAAVAMTKISVVLASFAVLWTAPARADLLGQTLNANITISGQDDHGAYTINVLSGSITVPGSADLLLDISVFKQLTEGGFSTASNQISGTVSLDIGANFIKVTMSGQVQPFLLESTFTGISGPILTDVDSTTGIMAGVNMDWSH